MFQAYAKRAYVTARGTAMLKRISVLLAALTLIAASSISAQTIGQVGLH